TLKALHRITQGRAAHPGRKTNGSIYAEGVAPNAKRCCKKAVFVPSGCPPNLASAAWQATLSSKLDAFAARSWGNSLWRTAATYANELCNAASRLIGWKTSCGRWLTSTSGR